MTKIFLRPYNALKTASLLIVTYSASATENEDRNAEESNVYVK
jgi:hypothetical protein